MLRKPYLIFLADSPDTRRAKTGAGLRDWCANDVLAEYALPEARATLGLPFMTPAEAAAAGARSMVIGVAPVGGDIPEHWLMSLHQAIDAGLDIVSGMHTRLNSIAELRLHAEARNVTLHDVRHCDRTFEVGSGKRRSGLRLLTVGTDCALGKKYTALALTAALRADGIAATFRATGQTGIMIAGEGVAVDAVVADFIAGAAESLSPANDPHHWDIIEGQGSLFHPGYAGVSLGLLHGSQPDALILCHDPRRSSIDGFPHIPLPALDVAIRHYVEAGRLTNPSVRCVGISLNTSALDEAARVEVCRRYREETGLPVIDPLRDSMAPIIASLNEIASLSQ